MTLPPLLRGALPEVAWSEVFIIDLRKIPTRPERRS
jgi:hypothetical protein